MFFLFLLKYPAQNGELYEHGDAHYDERCHEAMDAYLHTEPEEHYVKSEVHRMRTREAHKMLPRRLLSESETARGVVVYQKTHHITRGIGGINLNEQLQEVVNDIMNRSREASIEYKPHKLRLALLSVFQSLRLV